MELATRAGRLPVLVDWDRSPFTLQMDQGTEAGSGTRGLVRAGGCRGGEGGVGGLDRLAWLGAVVDDGEHEAPVAA